VSLSVNEGETLGIIGRNGAGKSTLLKILSRITKPTKGYAEIRGRVGSLLEVGTGFHSELTGRENVYLNGAILGMKRAEIEKKFDEIVAFSEIEEFLDTPVKHYSSGMYMRLAFSIAAHLEPEVLIVDEVLAVGDMEFQEKCLGKMDEVSKSGRTVLFVSHNLGSLAQICKKGLLLHKGRSVSYGNIQDTISDYLSLGEAAEHFKLEKFDETRGMHVSEVFLSGDDGSRTTEMAHNRDFFLEFRVRIERIRRGSLFCVALLNKYKQRVFTEHRSVERLLPHDSGDFHLKFRIPKNLIAPNNYSFLVQIFLPSGEIVHELFDVCPFSVIDAGSELSRYKDYGFVQIDSDWQIIE
jgi:homopolymeric O-antigen transport system ATP-binding protein